MAEYLRMVTEYRTLTGLSKDVMTNTMHFLTDETDLTIVAGDIVDEWSVFLHAIDGSMSDDIYDTEVNVVFFDMSDPEPRAPIYSDTVNLTLAATGTSLPLECSMVVSFAGPVTSGPGQGRRRGRIYLPAFVTAAVVSSAGNVSWEPTTVTAFAAAFASWASQPAGSLSATALQVFSPTTFASTSSLSASMTPVTRGWIDNEPDTQRRRGTEAGTKTPFIV